jgi:hypothetical protein
MQAIDILITQGRNILIAGIAGALLVVMAMAPAAQATSLAPEVEAGVGQESSADTSNHLRLTRDAMKFLEDNWYFDYGDTTNETEAESNNPASAEPSQDAFDFDAMERAPGLYTEPPDEATAPDAEDDSAEEEIDPALTRDRIKFLEDNWYLDADDVFSHDEVDESASSPSSEQNADRADSPEEFQEEDDEVDRSTDHEDNTLTHPWGGDALDADY